MLRETYYTNTTGGHNKDYLMVSDYEKFVLTCTWGPIGGTKQTDRYEVKTAQELMTLEEEKHARRIKHGYTLITQNRFDQTESEFLLDVSDLRAAERIFA